MAANGLSRFSRLKAKINEAQKRIGAVKKAKGDATELLKEKVAIEKEHTEMLSAADEKEVVMKAKLGSIGNLIHDSVPVDNNEDNNPTLRTWVPEGMNIEEKKAGLLSHHEVLLRLDGYAPEAGVKVVGHRGYFLRSVSILPLRSDRGR